MATDRKRLGILLAGDVVTFGLVTLAWQALFAFVDARKL
jgi:hypothetical protein